MRNAEPTGGSSSSVPHERAAHAQVAELDLVLPLSPLHPARRLVGTRESSVAARRALGRRHGAHTGRVIEGACPNRALPPPAGDSRSAELAIRLSEACLLLEQAEKSAPLQQAIPETQRNARAQRLVARGRHGHFIGDEHPHLPTSRPSVPPPRADRAPTLDPAMPLPHQQLPCQIHQISLPALSSRSFEAPSSSRRLKSSSGFERGDPIPLKYRGISRRAAGAPHR